MNWICLLTCSEHDQQWAGWLSHCSFALASRYRYLHTIKTYLVITPPVDEHPDDAAQTAHHGAIERPDIVLVPPPKRIAKDQALNPKSVILMLIYQLAPARPSMGL